MTEDEFALLRAFVESSAYKLLVAEYEKAVKSMHSQIESATELRQVFNLQGRINGIRYCQNAPKMLVDEYLRHQKEKEHWNVAVYNADRRQTNQR